MTKGTYKKESPKCPDCGEHSMLFKTYIGYLVTDEEPYTSGHYEESEEIETEISLHGYYCKKCQTALKVWISE